jgi:hypothetical protein
MNEIREPRHVLRRYQRAGPRHVEGNRPIRGDDRAVLERDRHVVEVDHGLGVVYWNRARLGDDERPQPVEVLEDN